MQFNKKMLKKENHKPSGNKFCFHFIYIYILYSPRLRPTDDKPDTMKSQQKKSSLSPKLQHHQPDLNHRKEYSIHIPFDLTQEILSRLPVKSFVKFHCVSKQWSSLITNSIIYLVFGYTPPCHLRPLDAGRLNLR